MGDRAWKEILLSELTQLRIVCKHRVSGLAGETRDCGAVIEIPLDKLDSLKKCPLCENTLRPIVDIAIGEKPPFAQFVTALGIIQKVPSVSISFILTDDRP